MRDSQVRRAQDAQMDYVKSLIKKDPSANSDAYVRLSQDITSSRSQDWFHKLDTEAKAEYRRKYPGTKFVNKTSLQSS